MTLNFDRISKFRLQKIGRLLSFLFEASLDVVDYLSSHSNHSLIHLLSTSFFQFINLYITSFVSHSFNSLITYNTLEIGFSLLIYITIARIKRSLLSDDVIAINQKKLKKSKSTFGLTNIVNLVGLSCVLCRGLTL